MMNRQEMEGRIEPVLKWPGGKRWISPLVTNLIRHSLKETYYEPFLGSGAVFFQLGHAASVLSDINRDLIETLLTIRSSPEAVLSRLWRLSNTSTCYYAVRRSSPKTEIGRAVRFIYLSKTSWGGIYRLNRRCEFNVPFGNSGRVICRRTNLLSAAHALRLATLRVADFEEMIALACKGDVIYADPPYTTLGENNGFLRYNERLFAWDDQVRLATCCWAAHRRGATAIVSGLHHPSLVALYRGWWLIKVPRHSRVSRLMSGHRTVTEVLMTNRRPPDALCDVAGVQRFPGSVVPPKISR